MRALDLTGNLTGKVLVLAGAGPGLGRQVARAASQAGALVVLAGRSTDTLAALASELDACGADVAAVRCDVTSDADCDELARTCEERFGGVDVVVYNAFHRGGMSIHAEHADLALWREVFDVNLFGAVRVVQRAVPSMRARGGGSIVLVGSQISRRVLPGRGDYATSKAALLTLTQVLAKELGRDGIRVNALVPGRMRGPTLVEFYTALAEAAGTTLEEEERKVAQQLALPRMVTDEEVARSVLYLASDLSAGVTGQTLDINAGETFS